VAYTILVAEDDRRIADLLRQLLSDEGYNIRIARDGVEALTAIEQEPPDVIVSDIKMPRLDGVQLATLVAARRTPIPFILTSAHYDGADIPGTIFVAKPFDFDGFVDLIRRLVTEKSA
jgi:two-component system response regulator MprA